MDETTQPSITDKGGGEGNSEVVGVDTSPSSMDGDEITLR